jgi:hypothetical protein
MFLKTEPFVVHEAGHASTVPSLLAPIEACIPDPEPVPPQDCMCTFASSSIGGAPESITIEDIEGVLHPWYPLPTKPFQVQPPPKITTGYAPTTLLDARKAKSDTGDWHIVKYVVSPVVAGLCIYGEKDLQLAMHIVDELGHKVKEPSTPDLI